MLSDTKQENTASKTEEERAISRQAVFFKPVVKKFVESEQTVYMVLTDKGRSIAVFDSLRACRHFAIRHGFEYHYAH